MEEKSKKVAASVLEMLHLEMVGYFNRQITANRRGVKEDVAAHRAQLNQVLTNMGEAVGVRLVEGFH